MFFGNDQEIIQLVGAELDQGVFEYMRLASQIPTMTSQNLLSHITGNLSSADLVETEVLPSDRESSTPLPETMITFLPHCVMLPSKWLKRYFSLFIRIQ